MRCGAIPLSFVASPSTIFVKPPAPKVTTMVRFIGWAVRALVLAPLVTAELCREIPFETDDDVVTAKIPSHCTILKLDEQGLTDEHAAAIAEALIAAPAQFNTVSLLVRPSARLS